MFGSTNRARSEERLVIRRIPLEVLREGRKDLYRAVLIALVIDRYPSHRIWSKLTSLYPDELIMLENAMLSALGAISAHGGEEGIRFLDQAPHFEYVARKWVTLMKPTSYLSASMDLWRIDRKYEIDLWLLAASNDMALIRSADRIGRNLYDTSRALLRYTQDNGNALEYLPI
jgi:hypothetical protein